MLMAQIWLDAFRFWLIPIFDWGIVFLIVVCVTAKIVLRVQRRYMNRRTDEAGAPRIFIPVRDFPKGVSAQDIEGIGYCIGFIIIIIVVPIAAFLGITFPVTLPEEMQMLIGAVFMVALTALFWGAGIITLIVSIKDFIRRNQQLKEALTSHS
jgi:hypothetical protein